MTAGREGAAPLLPSQKRPAKRRRAKRAQAGESPVCAPPGAASAALVTAPGIPPFVVWSKRSIGEAGADAVTDAVRTLKGMPFGVTPAKQPSLRRASDRRRRARSEAVTQAYHEKASL